MNRLLAAGLLVLLLGAPAGSRLPQSAVAQADMSERAPASAIDDTLKSWPEPARRSALLMLSKYGAPTRFDDTSLVWLHNGPWEKTVAYRDGWPQYANAEAQDYLRQVIGYRVPETKLEAITSFDPRVEADPSTNELAARSGSESVNFLLLNLTDDIITEKRTAADAKVFLDRTNKLTAAGKSSPYTEGLRFEAPNEKTVTP